MYNIPWKSRSRLRSEPKRTRDRDANEDMEGTGKDRRTAVPTKQQQWASHMLRQPQSRGLERFVADDDAREPGENFGFGRC